MAMLAEPRRKQKWTLNPRGKQWSEDTNKFGQKMLERMGWTSGKGLGPNGQGMTEHIRVSFKNDNSGIGFKNSDMDKAWTGHQEGFSELLKALQKNCVVEESSVHEVKNVSLSGKSLELKSKQSRARVHYTKFTRGKDVNKYSSKDLANIFGQKDLNAAESTEDDKLAADEKEDHPPESIGTEDKRDGVITINRGSIADYFKNKGSTFYKISENRNNSTDSEEEAAYAGFGFSPDASRKHKSNGKQMASTRSYGFVNPCLDLDSSEIETCPSTKSASSKKRKSQSKFYDKDSSFDKSTVEIPEKESSTDYKNGFTNPALNLASPSAEGYTGKEYEVSRARFGLSNSAFDPEDEPRQKRRVTFNDRVEYSTDPTRKKTTKLTLDKFEVENKKQKRKRKHEESTSPVTTDGFVNQALDVEEKPAEEEDNVINERKCRKAKRRRESRPSILETIAEISEDYKEDNRDETQSSDLSEPIQVANAIASELNPNDETQTGKKEKKKKKKKKKKTEDKLKKEDDKVENDINLDEEGAERTNVSKFKNQGEEMANKENQAVKSKKKKRKHKEPESVTNEDTDEATLNRSYSESTKTKKEKILKKTDGDNLNDDFQKNNGKQVSDKENTDSETDKLSKSKSRKRDKREKSLDKSVDTSCVINTEVPGNIQDEEQVEFNSDFNLQNPWRHDKPRMTKKLLKSFFHRNAISDFPGSNIHDIKGYGT